MPPTATGYHDAMTSWTIALRAIGRSEVTIKSYTDTVTMLSRFQQDHGRPADPEQTTTRHIRDYLTHRQEQTSPATAAIDFRNLRAFFNWLAREGDIPVSPVAKIPHPKVPEKTVDVLTDTQFKRLLKTCDGKTFTQRRDRAILLVMYDNGARVGGAVGLRYTPEVPETNDVYLDQGLIRLRLKGGRELMVPIGATTARAIDQYLRVRRKHSSAYLPNLWLGERGELTRSGVQQLVKRRGKDAGLPGLHPHVLRHTMAHNWMASGGSESDLMRIAGWTSPEMPRRYGRAFAEERARDAHRKMSAADRLGI